MKIKLRPRHIYFINRFTTSYTLKRKFETALLADPANTQPLIIITTKAEYLDVYQSISGQPEGYYSKINREVEEEILPQLLAVMADPTHADYADVSQLLNQLQAIKTARAQVVEEIILTEKLFFDQLNPNYVEPKPEPEREPEPNPILPAD
jgi:hypothetical protein